MNCLGKSYEWFSSSTIQNYFNNSLLLEVKMIMNSFSPNEIKAFYSEFNKFQFGLEDFNYDIGVFQ